MSLTFRPEATAELDAATQLDNRLHAAPIRLWFALLTVLFFLAAVVVWAFFGAAPKTVDGLGALIPPEGLQAVKAPVSGRVLSTMPLDSKEIKYGQVIVELGDDKGSSFEVMAPATGEIVHQSGLQVHKWINVGDTILQFVPAKSMDYAVILLDPEEAAQVKPGMPTNVSVDVAPSGAYGSITGFVKSVDVLPISSNELLTLVGGNEALASMIGGGTRAVIQLNKADTPSGFQWTSGSGPDFAIPPATHVHGDIIVSESRPVSYLIGGQ